MPLSKERHFLYRLTPPIGWLPLNCDKILAKHIKNHETIYKNYAKYTLSVDNRKLSVYY